MIVRPLLVAGLAAALTACAQSQPEASPTPLLELAIEPTSVETEAAPVASPWAGASPATTVDPTTTPAEPAPAATTTGPAPPPTTGTAPATRQPRRFATVATFDDPAGDEGLEAPSYADIRAVTLQDDGERLRVWVDVGAELPPNLNEGEVIGLGVDLYLDGADGDSDYQLFADGGSDGWHAYFQTPRGFIAYPGTFALGGRRVEFVVPWGSMGTPPRGEASVFLDWSRARPLLNAIGSDRAPNRGTAAWAR